jgi:hypothetical protein
VRRGRLDDGSWDAVERVAGRSNVSKQGGSGVRFDPSFSEADEVRVARVDDVMDMERVISVQERANVK